MDQRLTSERDARPRPEGDVATALRSRRALIGVTTAWVGLFGFLLLTSSPPRVPYASRDWAFTAGHLLGSLLLSVQLVAIFTPELPDRRARHRGAMLGLLVALVVVFGLEIAQEFRPVRGYQSSDGVLNVVGVGVGVVFASVIQQWSGGQRLLQRSTTAVTAGLALLVGVLVVL